MHPRLSYDYVKKKIENEEGYKLLSTEYFNAHKKLKVLCKEGHIYEVSWDVFSRGCRCNICSTEKTAKKQRHDIKFIRDQLYKEKYKLISNTYHNAVLPLKVICPIGHEVEFSWNFFQQGGRCPICFGTPKKEINKIKDYVESVGYKLLSEKYKNAVEKLKIECPEGHVFKVSWNNFSGKCGSRCPICWRINMYGENHPNWKGGISKEPYCEIFSDKDFKEYIKYRDGNKCLNPTCSKKSKYLAIHHIDYDKMSCREDNLISICLSCNTKANKDRNWHKEWYRAIMYRRYKYKGE